MRCSRCHRTISKAAITTDNLTLGPTCARLVGAILPRVPGQPRVHVATVLPGQLRLQFDEVAA